MYIGLPTHVCSAIVGSLMTLENPKSQILKLVLCIKMFAGLKSLWIVFYRASYWYPLITCFITSYASASYSFFFIFKYFFRSPSRQYSMIMYRLRFEFSTSCNCTIFGCLNLFKIRISSWMAFSKYRSFYNVLKSTFLMATFYFVSF